MSFLEKLRHAAETNGSLLCVGLDPDPGRLANRDVAAYLCAVVEATSDLVCAYKANLAFYEQLGEEGYAALRAVLRAIPPAIPTIADAKRGDVAHTAQAYARAIFDQLGFDAATVNPYLGRDSVEPFAERAERGVFIVCRSSNPGAADLQDLPVASEHGTVPLYQHVAALAGEWNTNGNIGLVAGATYPDEIRALRALCPTLPFLVPGIGAQEGELERAVRAGLDGAGGGLIINASRSILYASAGDGFAAAARGQAETLRDAIEALRPARAGPAR
jgi:orotidine-5'-phosphate decarboxylase